MMKSTGRADPLTAKGEKIMEAMKRPPSEGGYGPKKGEEVFYASKNKGTITGVEDDCPIRSYHDACRRGDSVAMARAGARMRR